MTRRRIHKEPRRYWTRAEDRVMRRRYPHESSKVVAAALKRSLSATHGRARLLGLHKTAKYMASPEACRLRRGDQVGKAYRYPKGHVPANKGMKRPGFAVGRMAETQFKRGVPSWRTAAVGSTRIADGYVYRKMRDTQGVPWTANWILEHRRVWIAAHGAIPPGHAVVFKNGDRMATQLDNLELITQADLMRRNTVHNLPAPLKGAVYALGALNRTITIQGRKHREEKHQ